MKTLKFTETQIGLILKQADAGIALKDVCQAGISVLTYYKWRSEYGGLEASELRPVKELEAEKARLKQMYAELALDNAAMKDLIAKNSKNCRAGAQARSRAGPHGHARAAGASVLRMRRPVGSGLVSAATGSDSARR